MTKYKSILVVDDNDGVRVSLKFLLKKMFDTVITIDSPEKILTTLSQEEVSIVLLDMNFSLGLNTGREGMFWLTNIKQKYPDIPVVLFTAYADIQLAINGLKQGASDFVIKPWDNTQLLDTLRNVLEKDREVRPLAEIESEHIRSAVDKCDGNLKLAAELLGISRQTLYNKLKMLN